jgi:2-iminobutanoate/2-iminopropanoate deaminase
MPYAQAIRFGNMVFVAGQVAIDPSTGNLIEGDIRAQTARVLDNVKAILEEAGTSMENCLDSICILRDIADFDGYNEVYRTYFPQDGPARVTFQAPSPRDNILIHIRIIAGIPDS